jgi:hypothetical protein
LSFILLYLFLYVVDHGGKSKGFAFVTMEESEAGEAAVKEISGANIDGREVRVEVCAPQDKSTRPRRDFGGGGGRGYGGRGGRDDYRGGDRRDRLVNFFVFLVS